jgi:hypothetical protein
LLEKVNQKVWRLYATQFHEMALAAKAVAALGNGVAAEIGEAEASLKGDAIFEKEGIIKGTYPLVVAKPRVEVGDCLPWIGIDGQPSTQAARIGYMLPIAETNPAAF